MKKLMIASLAVSLALWIVAGSQAFSQQSGGQQGQTGQGQMGNSNARSNQTMSGSVSSNGKTFTNDKDSKSYKVDNPEVLKGREGQQHVAVVVHIDPDTGVVHIMQVEAPDQQ
jgi:hypothetical protein